MTARARRTVLAVLALVLLLPAIVGVVSFFLPGDKAAADAKPAWPCEPLRIVSTYIALAECPTAETVAVIGAHAADYRDYFVRAGLALSGADRADLVFAAGALSADEQKGGAKAGAITVKALDMRGVSAPAFARELESAMGDVHVWMPGEHAWLVVSRPKGALTDAADALAVLAREQTFDDTARGECDSLPGLFASYVGTREEVMPAFASPLAGEVVPEWFVTREIPSVAWLDGAALDADIRKVLFDEIRSMQVIRRLYLEGNIASRAGKREEAIETWTRAAKRNAHDPLILERLVALRVNAEVFDQMGKAAMAEACYETMFRIRPTDLSVARRLAGCLNRLNRADYAKGVLELCAKARKAAGLLEPPEEEPQEEK